MGVLTFPANVPYEATDDTYTELTQLLEQRRARMLRIALRFTRDMEDAEDVVQEASLKALIHLATFRRESRMDTWLYAIICNTAVNRFRGCSRHREVSLEGIMNANDHAEPYSIRDPHKTPEEHCADREVREMIRAEIELLKDQHRSAVALCDLEGLSHSEAATTLELNLERFNARLLRGRRVLYKRLRKRAGARRG